MKNNLKKIAALCLLLGMFISQSTAVLVSKSFVSSVLLLDRGLEVHYVKMALKKGESIPKTITMYGVVYPLYQTREEAYNTVVNAGLKKDITTVYVISPIEKETEMITLAK
jgi:hypothetical protein